MKLIAKDSFYTDETRHVHRRAEFEVKSEETAKDLIKKGLAVEATEANRKALAPRNKAEQAPKNK
ncbi:hypothetical protein GOC40_11385 [Sinorhizobium meliloti]|nr:hypothetical protein [Sinorhizobium meliloti]